MIVRNNNAKQTTHIAPIGLFTFCYFTLLKTFRQLLFFLNGVTMIKFCKRP